MGIDNQFIDHGETLTLEFYNPGLAGDDTANATSGPADATERLISSLDFTNNSNDGGTLNWTVYNTVDGTTDSGTVNEVDGHYLIEADIDFNKIEITGGTDANARLTSVVIGERILPDGEDITFTVTGTDGDGDVTSSDEVTVTILPEAEAAPLDASFALASEETQESALVESDSDGDSLIATEGDDVFAFTLDDSGNPPADVSIADFGASGSDSLDLRDLLLGEEQEGADLTSYLNMEYVAPDTIVQVNTSGGLVYTADGVDPATVDQTITLEGVDLLGGNDSATAIQQMLEAGKLITD